MIRKWNKYANYLHSGDWQLHTTYTDGKSTIKEYFEAAVENKTAFLLFSEHVRKQTTYDYLKFKENVYSIGAQFNIEFAVGAEAKVLDTNGNIDLPDDLISEIEVVLFAFHAQYFLTKESYIEAVINTIKNPLVDIWAHPTSYHNWLSFDISTVEYDQIFSTMKTENVCYELNKKYPLPSLNELNAVLKNNLNISFGSDAHHASNLLSQGERAFFLDFIKVPHKYFN